MSCCRLLAAPRVRYDGGQLCRSRDQRVAWQLLALFARPEAPVAVAPLLGSTPAGKSSAHLAIALSGLSALGAEVVWTRLLSLTLGPTVYAFSIILAVFLIGMGIGSGIGTSIRSHARTALGISQLLLIPAIAWAGYMIADQLPYWDKNLSVHADPWHGFLFDFACCALALLPATLLWGASFPLALDAAAQPGADSARTVGAIYAANTTGAILGAIAFSIFQSQCSVRKTPNARLWPSRPQQLSSHSASNGNRWHSPSPPRWPSPG